MPFMNWIISALNYISEFFYNLAVESWDAFYVPDIIGDLFYEIHGIFVELAWDMSDFFAWLLTKFEQIGDILTWDIIKSYILEWLPDIEALLNWYDGWWTRIKQKVEEWWETTLLTVQGLISVAIQPFADIADAWNGFWNDTWPVWRDNLSEVIAAWDNFWTTIFPNMVDFAWLGIWWDARVLDVQRLIDTALSNWTPLLESWQETKDSVIEFFADPLEWLWARFTEWFLGPEV